MLYEVVSPPVSEFVQMLETGEGTTEHFRDVYIVNARTRHEAKWAAYKHARRRGHRWPEVQYDNGTHPLAGVRVEDYPQPGDPVPEECADEFSQAEWDEMFFDCLGGEFYVDATNTPEEAA